MKGIVVEIATLINAPPHHTTRATPYTLRSGTSSSSSSSIDISISISISIILVVLYYTSSIILYYSSSIIGISITLTMGNNWCIAYHTMHLKRPFLHLLLMKVAILPHFHQKYYFLPAATPHFSIRL